ncbi:MAG: aspartate aminotransferase family protein [Gemmatimonadales bacterium]|nr:aspartate aminotransferase family protein [Gemmatimonadales bacterium]NIN11317.1 aspartate aminotransferase family protein [Gemmatimonadales bacterium]NIN49916.1 aspartate aminotransferase family protein [Gemmatimonadales bacterium]NIP07380.1 aspartate aminotransferase family protein [Gemmatimonadales bacterium]NIR03075.1 aspartate aminotransferase family protein [Gemmatimonadales bacterium]
MTPEQFRQCGHAVVDWIARYMENVEGFPVLSQVTPGEIRQHLPSSPPEQGEQLQTILSDLDDVILPGITHWQSPNFFAYFPANASGPAILGDLVSSGLGVQGMLWATSPACTELETHVLDWLVEMLGLPEKFKSTTRGGGVIQDTASSATLCALVAARERASDFHTNTRGVDRVFTAYASTQAHSSMEKAAGIAGVGRDNLRLIDVDDAYAMRPTALEAAISRDLEAGHIPFFVGATVGSTSSTAIDPLSRIGQICRRHKLWLHVDAAHAGSAALCPEYRWIHAGLEQADSYCFNPHKWMLTNFDCDCLYVAERASLINSLSVLPEYLRNKATESGAVIDYRDWQLPLGRRFRALKLWFVIRHYGVSGLRQHIREHVSLAQEFAGWVEADDQFVLAAPVPLNLVCFRHVAGDEVNQRLLEALNSSGRLFLTHTKLDQRIVLRMAIGGAYTERRHVQRAWEYIQQAARANSA